MKRRESTCPGCGLSLPAGRAVYDGYFHTTPECWSVFTEVVGTEFGNAPLFGQVHMLTVDAYAVQHAGGTHPDKSVDVHLVGLHLVHERGIEPVDVPRHTQALARAKRDWPHFAPPPPVTAHSVFEVALSDSTLEHAARVRAWARAVWNAWRVHHPAIADLADGCFAR